MRVARVSCLLAAFVEVSVLGLCFQTWSNASTISIWPVVGGVVVLVGVAFLDRSTRRSPNV